jgi:nucleotide-binding universal stress UspA family protein
MPFLDGAYKVTVLSMYLGSTVMPTGEDVVEYLAWCGIKAKSVTVTADPSGAGAGKALMAAAAAEGADMLVMGAYSRNQLRRLIFGGVTGEVLANVTVPVLMVH